MSDERTLGDLIAEIRLISKNGGQLKVGFPPDFANTPFIAVASKIADRVVTEFDYENPLPDAQREKLARLIERRVAFLVYSLMR